MQNVIRSSNWFVCAMNQLQIYIAPYVVSESEVLCGDD